MRVRVRVSGQWSVVSGQWSGSGLGSGSGFGVGATSVVVESLEADVVDVLHDAVPVEVGRAWWG